MHNSPLKQEMHTLGIAFDTVLFDPKCKDTDKPIRKDYCESPEKVHSNSSPPPPYSYLEYQIGNFKVIDDD